MSSSLHPYFPPTDLPAAFYHMNYPPHHADRVSYMTLHPTPPSWMLPLAIDIAPALSCPSAPIILVMLFSTEDQFSCSLFSLSKHSLFCYVSLCSIYKKGHSVLASFPLANFTQPAFFQVPPCNNMLCDLSYVQVIFHCVYVHNVSSPAHMGCFQIWAITVRAARIIGV